LDVINKVDVTADVAKTSLTYLVLLCHLKMWSYQIGNQDLKQSESEQLSPVKMRRAKYGKMELVLGEWF